jgi:hypothetical protein
MPYSFVLPSAPTITPATDVIPIAYPNGYTISGYIAGNFKIGVTYTIQSIGDTNFTLIGASANTIGVEFIATGVGVGTGTASAKEYVLYATINRLLGLGRGAPVTKTADFTLAATENWIINNKATTSCTITLPAASLWTGREVMIQNYKALSVISASANVVPILSGAATTSILAATIGKWCVLVSDGTNWIITQSN